MNTADIIHRLVVLMRAVQALHLHKTSWNPSGQIMWINCVSRQPAAHSIHAAGCIVVTMAPHFLQIRW